MIHDYTPSPACPEGEQLEVRIGRTEMGHISIALDRYAVHCTGSREENEVREIQKKWDTLYRDYHKAVGSLRYAINTATRVFNGERQPGSGL